MTENNQLLHSLFEHEQHERTHLNVKFLRGTANNISPVDFRNEAANALVQVDTGVVVGDSSFEEDFNQVVIADFVNAL